MPQRPDATWIAPRLWQGARPPTGPLLRDLGFDVLVLTAKEYPPAGWPLDVSFPGVEVLRVHLDDSGEPATPEELRAACRVADEAAARLLRGKRVLVTCYMGLNRSGLVTALILREIYRISGEHAMHLVQVARDGALGNPYFQDFLERLPPPRTPAKTYSVNGWGQDLARVVAFSQDIAAAAAPV